MIWGSTMTTYKISDEGLQALVNGELSCTKVSDAQVKNKFLVEYDSIVIGISPQATRMQFCWKGVTIASLELPVISGHDTLTVGGLHGRMPLEISA